MLHDLVVFVRVDLDVFRLGETVLHAGGEDPSFLSRARYAVYGGVGLFVQPRALNAVVYGISIGQEGENALYAVLVAEEAQIAVPNIGYDDLFCGVGVFPLGRVSRIAHNFARVCINRNDLRKVADFGFSDIQNGISDLLYFLHYSTRSRICK